MEKNFMTVEEVAEELKVSKSYAYKVVRELNAEMRELGYLTISGRVNTSFFRKKYATAKKADCCRYGDLSAAGKEMMLWLYIKTGINGV